MIRDSCRKCGEPTGGGWAHTGDPTLCFECDYWTTQIEAGGGLVIGGRHYRVDGPEARVGQNEYPRVLGGRRYVILTDDGRRIVTDNLRTQGVIPARFRGRLPDNARFIEQLQRGRGPLPPGPRPSRP